MPVVSDFVYILRAEQLYPFPFHVCGKELERFPSADLAWCQEEPQNMGAWTFVDRRIEDLLSGLDIRAKRPLYAGRPAAAAPSTGSYKRHAKEQAKLVDAALAV